MTIIQQMNEGKEKLHVSHLGSFYKPCWKLNCFFYDFCALQGLLFPPLVTITVLYIEQ